MSDDRPITPTRIPNVTPQSRPTKTPSTDPRSDIEPVAFSFEGVDEDRLASNASAESPAQKISVSKLSLDDEITKKGNEVRALKENNGSKEDIAKAVDELKALKAEAAAGASAPAAGAGEKKSQVVDPWSVESDDAIDYDKLIKEFGTSRLDDSIIERFEKLTGQRAHHFLRRGIFFSHRDITYILDLYEKGQKFYLYTGRGPSSEALHLGHCIPFFFTKWLQDVFNCPLVIQLTGLSLSPSVCLCLPLSV